jgi:hypothetical protein
MVIDQLNEMPEQSRKYPLVFAVSVHPFIIGQPFRLRAFGDAIRHIVRHRDRLWITRPGEIARYCESLPKGTIPGSQQRMAAGARCRFAICRTPRRCGRPGKATCGTARGPR